MSKLQPALNKLTLPVSAASMFLFSPPKPVTGQCRAGIADSMPALNAAPSNMWKDRWGSGQGFGAVKLVQPLPICLAQRRQQHIAACRRFSLGDSA
ncbi:hypothetical protein ACQHGN_001506 [Pseudomonas aeruginosa]|nr:hypothetical protein [Pseudomonas aeruginosa]